MDILLCIDGSSTSLQSADLIAKLNFPLSSKIIALGVSGGRSDLEKINLSMDILSNKFAGKYSITRKIRSGIPSTEILAEAVETTYDLVAVGGGGGQLGLLQPKLGSTASQLARRLHTHFMVARNVPEKIKKILVCAGAEAGVSETMSLGGAWIANSKATIVVLHVVPEVKATNNTPPGQDKTSTDLVLGSASRELRQAGIKNEIIPHQRHGLVVEEALLELAEGEYDLLVIGAHYQPGHDLWKGTLWDDVTDQLLNRSNCSVLII